MFVHDGRALFVYYPCEVTHVRGVVTEQNAGRRNRQYRGPDPGAGLLVGLIGDHPTLIGVIIVFAAAALIAALSPLREAVDSV
jgi:hypothetical protein